jgi:hypothetical protein
MCAFGSFQAINRETTRMRVGWQGPAVLSSAALAFSMGLSALSPVSAAPGKDVVFTVANYPVEATAKDAVTAKDQAQAEGQNAAFKALLKRLVPVTSYNRVQRMQPVKAGEYLSGVSVRSEQTSSTQYIASLDFSFQPEAVRAILQREGIPFVERQAPEITLVAVNRLASDPPGKVSDGGNWSKSWKGQDLDHTLSPIKLDTLRSVIHPDTMTMLMSGDGSADRIIAGEYKSETVVFAIAEVDEAAGKLNVTLAGRDAVGPLSLQRTYRIDDGGVVYAMDFAAIVSLGIIEGRWKSVEANMRGGTAVMASPGVPVMVLAEFNGINQWNDIRAQLLETPGVEDMDIQSVSASSATITLRYPGGGDQLARTLSAQGLTLQNTGGGWLLKANF